MIKPKKQIKQPSFWAPIKAKNNFLGRPMKSSKLFGFKSAPKQNNSVKLSNNFFRMKSTTPVKLSTYPARTKQETRLIDRNPFGDKDRDRVPNFFDCRPLNRFKQGSTAPSPLLKDAKTEAQRRIKERYDRQDTSIRGYFKTLMDERKINKINKLEQEKKDYSDRIYKNYRENEEKEKRIVEGAKKINTALDIYETQEAILDKELEKQRGRRALMKAIKEKIIEPKQDEPKYKEPKAQKEPKYKEPKEEKEIYEKPEKKEKEPKAEKEPKYKESKEESAQELIDEA